MCRKSSPAGGKVILFSDQRGIDRLGTKAITIELPAVDPFVAPILYGHSGAIAGLPRRGGQGDGCRSAA